MKIQTGALSALFLMLPALADAGTITGTVEMVQVGSGATPEGVYGLVTVSGTASGQPSCATDSRFAFNPGTEEGKAFLSLLVMAKALEKTVQIFGTTSCNITGLPENERISYMRLL
jgi:hypothetical protein